MPENSKMPDAAAIEKLFSVATRIESAEYFRDMYVSHIREAKLEKEYQPVVDEIDKYIHILQSETTNTSNYWSGKSKDEVKSAVKQFFESEAAQAIEQLKQIMTGQDIEFNFAMDENSKLVQGSMVDGEPASPEVETQMDAVFTNWLVEHGRICDEEGVVHDTNEDGEQGNPTNPEQYRKEFEREFGSFVKERTDGALNVTVYDRTEEMGMTPTHSAE